MHYAIQFEGDLVTFCRILLLREVREKEILDRTNVVTFMCTAIPTKRILGSLAIREKSSTSVIFADWCYFCDNMSGYCR